MTFRITQADLSHLSVLVPLFEAYRAFYRQPANPAGAEDFLKARLTQGDATIYLVYEGDTPVGFTQLYPLFSSTQLRRLWLLNDLYVAPAFRGRGHSKRLIDRAKQLVQDTEAAGVMLETEQSNMIGNQLYLDTNFALDQDHNYYFWTNPNVS